MTLGSALLVCPYDVPFSFDLLRLGYALLYSQYFIHYFIGMLYYLGLDLCPVSQTYRAVLLCNMLSVPGMQGFLSGPEGHQMSV